MQELFLEYGVEFIVETLVEGFSRVKRCTNEGRALMSLDLQVCMILIINQYFTSDVYFLLDLIASFLALSLINFL